CLYYGRAMSPGAGPVPLHRFCCGASRERLEQPPGFLEVNGVKPLSEPAVDRRQEGVCFSLLALLLPQAAQAHGRPQFKSTGLLGPRSVKGLVETPFRLVYCRRFLLQEQATLEAVQLGLIPALAIVVHEGPGFG